MAADSHLLIPGNRIYLAGSDSTYEAVPHRCMGVGDQTGWYLFSWLCHFQVTWGTQLRLQSPHQQKENNSTKPMGLSKIEGDKGIQKYLTHPCTVFYCKFVCLFVCFFEIPKRKEKNSGEVCELYLVYER